MQYARAIVVSLLTALLLGSPVAACSKPQIAKPREKPSMQSPVRLSAKFEFGPDTFQVEYTFENASNQTVLLFDRMWDFQTNAMNANWAYVEIRDGKALVKRALEIKPDTLMVEKPPVPYGREVLPGASLSGSFALPLPLKENQAYGTKLKPNGQATPVRIQQIAFAVGWGVKPDNLPPGIKPVDVGADQGLLLLPYGSAKQIQRLLMATPMNTNLEGIAIR